MKIYAGNLSYRMDETDLRKLFEEYGEVTSVNLITDRDSGRSKGFAFIEMPNDEEGQNAIDNLNRTEVQEREIVVNLARPKRRD